MTRLARIIGPGLPHHVTQRGDRCGPIIFEEGDHEIYRDLLAEQTRKAGIPLAIILPVGPMGMYRWAVYFLREWGVRCDHVHGFNMDEWSDAEGNTLPAEDRLRSAQATGARARSRRACP